MISISKILTPPKREKSHEKTKAKPIPKKDLKTHLQGTVTKGTTRTTCLFASHSARPSKKPENLSMSSKSAVMLLRRQQNASNLPNTYCSLKLNGRSPGMASSFSCVCEEGMENVGEGEELLWGRDVETKE